MVAVKKKKKKKVQPPLPAERGALVPVFLVLKSFCFVSGREVRNFFSLFHLLDVFFSFQCAPLDMRELYVRMRGEQLAALTWECEVSFEMTSALLKKWNPMRHSGAARNLHLSRAHIY